MPGIALGAVHALYDYIVAHMGTVFLVQIALSHHSVMFLIHSCLALQPRQTLSTNAYYLWPGKVCALRKVPATVLFPKSSSTGHSQCLGKVSNYVVISLPSSLLLRMRIQLVPDPRIIDLRKLKK